MSDRRKILRAIKREGRKIKDPHARRVYLRAAVQTGLVESNLSNPSGGDADSAGWRQERASLYKDPTNIQASARRFRQEFQQQYDPGEKSYDVAAQVQRPAAQYRGRYRERAGEAARILKGSGGMGPTASSSGYTTTTTTTPGVDNSGGRRDAKLSYLQNTHDPDALLNLGLSLRGLQDTPSTRVKVKGAVDKVAGSAMVDAVQAEANRIDAKHYNYAWGGGHNPQGKPTRGVGHGSGPDPGYDCSGAIARVLGIDARVSGEFAKWGKPGRAPGGKGITVYSSPTHVLMEKDGHFFGTSSDNPGGGPGWIPRKKISAAYLRRFTARHA